MKRKRVCFVTGTRAEFGLMRSALEAIRAHRGLVLQLVATGIHLDRTRGNTIGEIGRVDAVVPWRTARSQGELAVATGAAMAEMADCFKELRTDVVLVVGDRVEAFAAASAGAIGGLAVAHVHGGDRAMGQVDELLRHAITKLAHVHFPATPQSGTRIARMGEEPWRIHVVGSPGIDGILQARGESGMTAGEYALIVLHPVDANEKVEEKRARDVLAGVLDAGVPQTVLVFPNTDPGAQGIVRAWTRAAKDARCFVHRHVERSRFLGLMADAAMLVGNSSSGIIEAASFGTPVIDVGPRQQGRERNGGVIWVDYGRSAVEKAAAKLWNAGRPVRRRGRNLYAAKGESAAAGVQIADILGRLELTNRLKRKLITY